MANPGRRRPSRSPFALQELDAHENPGGDPEGVIGATLCMMSCTMTSGRPLHLERITANLAWLAENPKVHADLRVACHRLWQHWEGVCAGIAIAQSRMEAVAPVAAQHVPTKH